VDFDEPGIRIPRIGTPISGGSMSNKGSTAPVVLGLMFAYDNFTIAPWIYLSLHGTYGVMWLIKDALYPDKKWEEETSIGQGLSIFLLLGVYWIAPFILISSGVEPLTPLLAVGIITNIMGVLLHFGSDAQKYFTLKYRSGLITEGFFSRCRNPNYLGEILIYLGFAILTQSWIPFAILGAFVAGIFVPNMLKKDISLSRYPEFAAYKQNSGLLIPKLFVNVERQQPESSN
jgi:protein-S-isoprenylcysteine O-methyltransferase Ste14